jgi:hypothetical protein
VLERLPSIALGFSFSIPVKAIEASKSDQFTLGFYPSVFRTKFSFHAK